MAMKTDFPYEDIPDSNEYDNNRRKRVASRLLMALGGVAIIAFGFASTVQPPTPTQTFLKVVLPSSVQKKSGFGSVLKQPNYASIQPPVANLGVKFTTNRVGYPILEYFGDEPNENLNYKILENYTGVVEPYASMNIILVGQDLVEGYKYTICSSSSSSNEECTTNIIDDSFYYECSPGDTYSVSIISPSGETAATGSLMCIYVRRELRSLLESDLEKSIQAMWTMWSVDQDEGEAMYGSDYLNYARLLEYHYFNAAWQDADHVHEGLGFLPQHLKIDLYFSKSFTAIEPSLSLFYWDFTM